MTEIIHIINYEKFVSIESTNVIITLQYLYNFNINYEIKISTRGGI